jgi:hypothetical protein
MFMLHGKSYNAIFLIFGILLCTMNKKSYISYGYSSQRPWCGFNCNHIQNWENWLFFICTYTVCKWVKMASKSPWHYCFIERFKKSFLPENKITLMNENDVFVSILHNTGCQEICKKLPNFIVLFWGPQKKCSDY